MQTEAKVFIIDQDAAFRESLQTFLTAMSLPSSGFANAEEFLAQWDDSQAGCLLTELFLSGMSGIELQQQLNERNAPIPVIFISGHADVQTAVQAIQSGAIGFLTKPFSRQTLLENLREALAKDNAQRARLESTAEAALRIENLTRRERQLLDYVVKGLKNREIADKLDLSLKTVEMHRSRMMKKMQVDSVADLLRVYLTAYPQTIEDSDFYSKAAGH